MALGPVQLLTGYARGIFPMAEEDGTLHWYRPDPRGILPLDGLHVSKSLRRTLRSGRYELRWNHNFDAVLASCADREKTWLQPPLAEVLRRLHAAGHAHSVECWDQHGLAGGLYGISLGGAFFGESMFSCRRDASKVALVHLVEALRQAGFSLLDVQWTTPHLVSLGAIDVSAAEFALRLQTALRQQPGELPGSVRG